MSAEHGKPHGSPKQKAGRPQGKLLVQGVEETGESKGLAVMAGIGATVTVHAIATLVDDWHYPNHEKAILQVHPHR